MTALARYEEMRGAVERCARIDEAADIRDKAAALAAYARQRDDADLEVWTQEIKLRASVRIGELVRELDTAQPGPRAEIRDSAVGHLSKTEAIEQAGMTPRTAQRYQELAGPREEQAQKAGKAGAEKYFAQARADKKPATMDGLRGAIKEAITATVGAPPRRPVVARAQADRRVMIAYTDFTGAVEVIATISADFDELAALPHVPVLHAKLRAHAVQARETLGQWLAALENVRDAA